MKTRAKQKSNLEQTQKKIEVTKSNLANWTLPWWSQNLVNRCITAGKAFKDHLLTTFSRRTRPVWGQGKSRLGKNESSPVPGLTHAMNNCSHCLFQSNKSYSKKFSLSNKILFLTNILLLFPCSCFQMASIAIIGDYLNCTSLSKIRYGPCRCRCEKDK